MTRKPILKNLWWIILLLGGILCYPMKSNGQVPLMLYNGQASSLYQSNLKIGLSLQNLSSEPLFKVEQISQMGTSLTAIKQLLLLNGTVYGLYQTGQYTQNYFEGPMKLNSTLSFNGSGSKIGISNAITEFPFEYVVAGPDTKTPLTIKPETVVIKDLLECNTFQMHTGSGTGKVMICDADGIGSWSDPSQMNDRDWIRTLDDDLYSNCRRVGIGTTLPRGKLEIECSTYDPTKYGLILNQQDAQIKAIEIRFDNLGEEKWAIGQRFISDDPDRNSFFLWNESLANYSLIVDGETGKVGIGTTQPASLLDVHGNIHANTVNIGTNAIDPGNDWKLYVDGGIKAREMRVTVQSYPDYVFEPGYPLGSVSDLKEYIRREKRLPGMITAPETEKNQGIDVGKMQVMLLEKIEEQALYIIQLQDQIDDLKAAVSAIK